MRDLVDRLALSHRRRHPRWRRWRWRSSACRACLARDLNGAYQEPQPIDPFGLAAHGLDAGLGTMLLQGVAEVR